MNDLPDDADRRRILGWRKDIRRPLIHARTTMPNADRARLAAAVMHNLESLIDLAQYTVVGLYWPIRGELDLRQLAKTLVERGTRIGLPVVVQRAAPVEFREWRPGLRMERGFWNIPVPSGSTVVHPGALVVPLVGHDDAGYRLGHGGGYYDRTLAARVPRPLAIGVGLDAGRLETIQPLPHDIPMDAIVTETSVKRYDRRGGTPAKSGDAAEPASPTCLLGEIGLDRDPPWRR